MTRLGITSFVCATAACLGFAQPVLAQTKPKAQAQGQTQTQAQTAAPVVMLCAFEDKGYSGWIPELVLVTRQANGRIEVFDPILQTLVGKPIKAVIVADSRRERSYGWALAGVTNVSGQYSERIDFRLTVKKADSTARMTVTPEGYDNVITGDGLCGQPGTGGPGR